METNPSAKSIGVVSRRAPFHAVAIQLKVFTAEGAPMTIVSSEKAIAEYGLSPLMNMWCPHTSSPRNAIEIDAQTMARYPNTGLREKLAITCETMPMPGRIAI